MNKINNAVIHWRPGNVSTIAGLIAVVGLLLTSVNWYFLLVTAAGAFGPGILRELGWLSDKDELQLQANYRAGYHAYLVGGLLSVLLVAYFRSSAIVIEQPQELATLSLVVLWFTWFLSSLIGYWGAQRASSRILLTFGCVWIVFAILSNTGSEWTGWTALLLHPLLALPFLVLAWLSKRFPRLAGVLLLAMSVFFVQFFGIFQKENMAFVTQAVTFVLFVGPLLASGIALSFGYEIDTDEVER